MTFTGEFYLVSPDFLEARERDAVRLTLATGRGVGLYGFAHGSRIQWVPAAHGLLAVVDGAALEEESRAAMERKAARGWCGRFEGLHGDALQRRGAHHLVLVRDGEELLHLATGNGAAYLTPAAARALRVGPASEVWPVVPVRAA